MKSRPSDSRVTLMKSAMVTRHDGFGRIQMICTLVWLAFGLHAQGADHLQWNRESHRVNANLDGWKLARVVQEVARQSGWEVYAEAGLTRKVSVKFKDLPTGVALRRFLGDLNFAVMPRRDGAPRLYVFETSKSAARTRILVERQERSEFPPAIRAALERLKPENLPDSHRIDFQAFGTNAVAELMAGLSSPNPEVRRATADALGHFGEQAKPAVESLVTGLGDTDLQVQLRSAAALGRLGQEPQLVLPLLIRNLQHPMPVVRAWNADAIGQFRSIPKEHAAAIATRLSQGLEDSSPMVRPHFEKTLARFSSPSPPGKREP